MITKFLRKLVNIKHYLESNPYTRLMRLHRPIGIYLTLFPALWSLLFATKEIGLIIFYGVIFTLGAILVRSMGCIANDYLDKDFDALVERSKIRPLASKELTVKNARNLFIILALGSVLLLLFLPLRAQIISLAFAVPILLYPLFKRFTYYPQVFLGLVFNAGVLIAWYCINIKVSYVPILVYISAVLWTIGYDTIYAHQDREDDLKAGVKSLAIKWGENTASNAWISYQLSAACLVIVGLNTHMNLLYYLFIAAAAYHLYWQTATLDINNPEDCAKKFKSNQLVGLLILLGIIIGRLYIPFV